MKYSEHELFGRRFIELIHPDIKQRLSAFMAGNSFDNRRTTITNFSALAKDGSEVWIGQNVQVLLEQ